MGCDIHLFTEIKKSISSRETWVNVDNWRYNPYYNTEFPEGERMLQVEALYGGRNYDLFGILAGVRSNLQYDMIDAPRGLPVDVSDIVKNESDRWDTDGHSHSWLTLRELKEYVKNYPKIKGVSGPKDILKPIIKEMTQRVRDEFWVWGKEEKPELEEKIRIVFWFDN
jgi:hypothetical protein